jgi:hypothetical protein
VPSRPDIELKLLACRGLSHVGQVVEIVERVREAGLWPEGSTSGGEGSPEAAQDLAGFLATRHFDSLAENPSRSLRRLHVRHMWNFPVFDPEMPCARASGHVQLLHPEMWVITFSVMTFSLPDTGRTPAAFFESWGDLLQRVGTALYPIVRPELGILTTPTERSSPEWFRLVSRRRLIVGWRTWFGRPYVDEIGVDRLAHLPGGVKSLCDGGIVHQSRAPLAEVAARNSASHRELQAFVKSQGGELIW